MKVSLSTQATTCCPQAFYAYGTYKEDGTPNFGLFCWFSFCWDGERCVMACIGGDKLTKDRIRATGRFSANLVSEELLPQAYYFGNTPGYNPDKMKGVDVAISKGQVLDVPVLEQSPWVYELEVKRSIPLDGSDIFLCRIRNILVDERLAALGLDDDGPIPLGEAKPVVGWGGGAFFKVGERLSPTKPR